MIALLLLAAAARAAEPKPEPLLSQDVTIRARAPGPVPLVPPPAPTRPVVDEVLRSLALGAGAASAPETVRVSPGDSARLAEPFPDPPFLALSPRNIRALCDSWTFSVLDGDGRVVWSSAGVGRPQGVLDWDGSGPDDLLAAVPGRRYRYRFVGRRGGGSFVVESEPVALESFARRLYGGERRLEAALPEIFAPGKAALASGGERYLDAMAAALRAGGSRADGSVRFELRETEPRGRLARARARTVVRRFSAALGVDPARVKVLVLPPERGEALAVLVPPAKGPAFGNE
ncbi:MAG: hypothetical protein KGM24_06290 [Elusimicrobia bacterium]|nr:hypothetical protein [Elusimicrobiota bacterium]